MDGVCTLSLKPSVLRASFFAYEDVTPGAITDCVVESVDAGGAVLSLGAGLRARATLAHLSDSGAARAGSKLKVGATVKARILTVDAAAKRATATLKPSLLGSKYPALARAADAQPGTVAHGYVTGVKVRVLRGAHARACALH
jgi:rRNA biogenesis protein RRP5